MLKRLVQAIIETIFPRHCLFCKKHGALLCADCQTLLEASPHHTARKSRYLSDLYISCDYENKFVQYLIHKFKYEPFYKELGPSLGNIIIGHLLLSQAKPDPRSIIIPVPLATNRLRWRGYNQAQIIAKALSDAWEFPLVDACLIKNKNTKIQANLSKKEREMNLKNAFCCLDSSRVKNKPVLLVDDVVTTGATLEECAKTLLHNGALKVTGIALAHANNS